MIHNTVLRGRIDKLKNDKKKLVEEKLELGSLLTDIGITKQAAHKQLKGLTDKIEPERLELRQVYAKRLKLVEEGIVKINDELKPLFAQEKSEENLALYKIFEEIFSHEQIIEIREEAKRRMAGEHPFKISFNVQESIEVKEQNRKYKKQIIELLDTMVAFRINLTNMIDKGCDKFGKAEFLTFISPLNRLITPTSELEKIKRKIIG